MLLAPRCSLRRWISFNGAVLYPSSDNSRGCACPAIDAVNGGPYARTFLGPPFTAETGDGTAQTPSHSPKEVWPLLTKHTRNAIRVIPSQPCHLCPHYAFVSLLCPVGTPPFAALHRSRVRRGHRSFGPATAQVRGGTLLRGSCEWSCREAHQPGRPLDYFTEELGDIKSVDADASRTLTARLADDKPY